MHTEQRQHRDLTGRYNGLDDYLREQYNDAVGILEILEEESITLKDGIHRLVNIVTSRIASEILAS
jgi:hypothetical protein